MQSNRFEAVEALKKIAIRHIRINLQTNHPRVSRTVGEGAGGRNTFVSLATSSAPPLTFINLSGQRHQSRAVGKSATHLFSSLLLLIVFASVSIGQTSEPVDTIRVDSDLVDLKVSVIGSYSNAPLTPLQQKDFLVLEDGLPQEIAFFAASDAPFDLILLLDLSGSTSDKMKLIRRSAKRFVDATRPTDRVAIVTFTDELELVSGFSVDRQQLKKRIDRMEKTFGGTKFWDALRFVTEKLVPLGPSSRRTAVIVMTDGIDNALPGIFGDGSNTPFPNLLRIVRDSDALIFPIYLDTEEEEFKRHRTPREAYQTAREQLAQLAETCGTTVYRAAKIEDLETVYDRVINDLSTVYSIGYRPSNRVRDGKWRSIAVQLNDRSGLLARSKRGYYAKPNRPE